MQPDVLEQIRLLSNIDDERGTLLQIILVGQTDLEPLLSRPELRQLQQRVSRRFRLEPLTRDEVKQYIIHRLALARDGKPPSQLSGATELARELADWAATNASVEFTPDAMHAVSQLSAGLPRVINLLCDRSLEEAYASRVRLVDRPLILTAARMLGVGATRTPVNVNATARSTQAGPDEFWTDTWSSSETAASIVEAADETAPVGFSAFAWPAKAPHRGRYLVLATCLTLAAVALLFGIRWTRPPATQTPSSVVTSTSSATRASSAPPDPAPADAVAPPATPTAETPRPPASTGPSASIAAPSAPAAISTGERFDIVVASFRTDARAAAVASQVAALGLPMRRRVSDSWQQVVSGPFASRSEAEAAQQRLHGAGLTGTQIASSVR